MLWRAAVLITCLLAAAAGCPQNALALSYQVHDLGVLPGTVTTWAESINDSGQVVGWAQNAQQVRYPVIWDSSGNISRIGSLTGEAKAINNAGQVTGYPGFLWSPAAGYRAIGLTAGYGINSRGQVSGFVNHRAAIWNPDGTITNLGEIPGQGTSYGWEISDSGAVAGFYEVSTTSSVRRPFKWTPETGLVRLPVLSSYFSHALGINSSGQVCGDAYESPGKSYPVVWEPDGTLRKLGVPQSKYFYASGTFINDAGYVVGTASDFGGSGGPPAFWTPDGTLSLLDVLPGYDYGEALCINEKKQIVGYCTSQTTLQSHAVLWEPIPEPSALLALLCGVAGVAWRRRRVRPVPTP